MTVTNAGGLIRLNGSFDNEDRALVGGKAVGLAALMRAGLTVPDTWVLPVGAEPATGQLAELARHAPRWAVRSSATVEDGGGLSYAGMFRTELDRPVAGLAASIARVRASALSSRVAAYRKWAGHGDTGVGMAVVLQPYRVPVRSAIWLGRGLATGRLEWGAGSGEALVSGAVIPVWEEWSSTGYVDGSHHGVLQTDSQPIGELCVAVQRRFGAPADLELAILDDGLVWLQFRPMTTRIGPAPLRLDTADAHVVQGIAASAGQATGEPVCPRDTTDARWHAGAVLLTEQTDPDWVPLMAEASALVTAVGGMLCHTAIVARELGVPCVTGVGSAALERLASAARLTVDGTAGTVSVLPPDVARDGAPLRIEGE